MTLHKIGFIQLDSSWIEIHMFSCMILFFPALMKGEPALSAVVSHNHYNVTHP